MRSVFLSVYKVIACSSTCDHSQADMWEPLMTVYGGIRGKIWDIICGWCVAASVEGCGGGRGESRGFAKDEAACIFVQSFPPGEALQLAVVILVVGQ